MRRASDNRMRRFGALDDWAASTKNKCDINCVCTAPIERSKCCRSGNADRHSGRHNAKGAAVLRETWAKSQCLSRILCVKRASGDRLSIERHSVLREALSPVPPFVVACCARGRFCSARGGGARYRLWTACAARVLKGIYCAAIRARRMVRLLEKGSVVGSGLLCQKAYIAQRKRGGYVRSM